MTAPKATIRPMEKVKDRPEQALHWDLVGSGMGLVSGLGLSVRLRASKTTSHSQIAGSSAIDPELGSTLNSTPNANADPKPQFLGSLRGAVVAGSADPAQGAMGPDRTVVCRVRSTRARSVGLGMGG